MVIVRFHIKLDDCSLVVILFTLLVAGAVADINRTVAEGDAQKTLQALQVPSAGLRAVLPECAETYQAELAERQTNGDDEGNYTYCMSNTC